MAKGAGWASSRALPYARSQRAGRLAGWGAGFPAGWGWHLLAGCWYGGWELPHRQLGWREGCPPPHRQLGWRERCNPPSQAALEGAVDHIQLLLAGQAVEVHSVARHADGQLGVPAGRGQGCAVSTSVRGWATEEGDGIPAPCPVRRSLPLNRHRPFDPLGYSTTLFTTTPLLTLHAQPQPPHSLSWPNPNTPTHFSGCSIASIRVSFCSTLMLMWWPPAGGAGGG